MGGVCKNQKRSLVLHRIHSTSRIWLNMWGCDSRGYCYQLSWCLTKNVCKPRNWFLSQSCVSITDSPWCLRSGGTSWETIRVPFSGRVDRWQFSGGRSQVSHFFLEKGWWLIFRLGGSCLTVRAGGSWEPGILFSGILIVYIYVGPQKRVPPSAQVKNHLLIHSDERPIAISLSGGIPWGRGRYMELRRHPLRHVGGPPAFRRRQHPSAVCQDQARRLPRTALPLPCS